MPARACTVSFTGPDRLRAGRRKPVGSGGKEPERDPHGEHGQGAGLVAIIRQEPERQNHEGTAEGIAGVLTFLRGNGSRLRGMLFRAARWAIILDA